MAEVNENFRKGQVTYLSVFFSVTCWRFSFAFKDETCLLYIGAQCVPRSKHSLLR